MTPPTLPALDNTPVATGPQLKRRQMLAMPMLALPMLAACGGRQGPSVPNALRYDTEQALYVVGEAIAPNRAHLESGSSATYTSAPGLPTGLSLDPANGVITGTPTTLQRQSTYTMTASNAAGNAQAPLRITVTGRGAWSAASTITGARHYATSTRLGDGRLLVAGGMIGGASTDSAQLYDPVSGTWAAAAGMLSTRTDAMSVLLADGRVLVFGGGLNVHDATSLAEIYDPVADTWTATGGLVESRIRASAHRLPDGKVIVAGGFTASPATVFRQTVEVYDPATGLWTLLPQMLSVPRAQHASALLPGGATLLLAGGLNSGGFVTTAELYAVDGSADTVIPYGIGGSVQQAVSLDDGSVLVTGDGSANAMRFDPAASTWTSSTTVGGARSLPTMTVLADGRVLLAGGSSLNTAEIYNPDVNRWTAAAPMADARRAAVASLLLDGSVLVVGGFLGAAAVNGSERYTV